MLQHLLNTTAIWLLSLVIFDAVLRKETFHTYNRVYLLFTFILGIFLPLWTWHSSAVTDTNTIQTTIESASILKANIVRKASITRSSFSWEYFLRAVYWAGVAVSSLLLIAEVFKIRGLYVKGKKTKEGTWTIIETGKDHAPFSLFHLLFVSSKEVYSSGEWAIVCRHEEQHGRALHFIDLFIIQISRIVFWFHPLVYAYNKRLLLIHEYQADAVTYSKPSEYGKFLLEQALLQPAPFFITFIQSFTHKKKNSYAHTSHLFVQT